MTNQVTAFIPCRKGSERVKNKNIRRFAGVAHGLLELKLEQVLNIPSVSKVILSTNDEEILEFAESLNTKHLILDRRRESLCQSSTSTDELIRYIPEIIQEGSVLWTHVTSPFIDEHDYASAIDRYFQALENGYDSLMSVTRVQKFLFDETGAAVNFDRSTEKWPRTQTIQPYFEANSGYFISPVNHYIELGDRIGKKVFLDEIGAMKSFDIDWEDDFLMAEKLYAASEKL